jgi:CBS domain-containing protein
MDRPDQTIALDELSVGDIMMRDVITTTPETSVADLIRLLEFEQISGAPVVEGTGVVGVVSVTDILRLAAHDAEIDSGDTGADREWLGEDDDEDEGSAPARARLAYFSGTAGYPALLAAAQSKGGFTEFTVREIMTPATFSVHASTSVTDLARFLARGRIHRSLVLDGDRLEGIVTAFDIVRAIAGILPDVYRNEARTSARG